jgi:methionyl-tRNA formyltransferase
LKVYYKKKCKSNYWRKRSDDDGRIDWRMSSLLINNMIRALSKPYTNAFFCYKNKRIHVLKAKIIKSKNNSAINNFEPGKILKNGQNSFDVKCGEGIIRILEINGRDIFKKNTYL